MNMIDENIMVNYVNFSLCKHYYIYFMNTRDN